MSLLNREKRGSLRRVLGDDLQFKTEELEDGRTAIVIAHYFRRPRDVHRNPPVLSPEQLAHIADVLNARSIEIRHGTDHDCVWEMIIENLPTLVLVPSK